MQVPPSATGEQPEAESPPPGVMVMEEFSSSVLGRFVPKMRALRYEVPEVAVMVPVLIIGQVEEPVGAFQR